MVNLYKIAYKQSRDANYEQVLRILNDSLQGASVGLEVLIVLMGGTPEFLMEYARDGIRVNALVAGGFDTDMLRSAVKQIVGDDPGKIAEGLKGYADRVPLGRVGDPLEAAQAAFWLCSSAASYVTGQSMIVDGDLHPGRDRNTILRPDYQTVGRQGGPIPTVVCQCPVCPSYLSYRETTSKVSSGPW